MTTRSRSMSSGHGLRTGCLRMKGRTFLRLRRCGLRGKLIFARRGDELFELKLQLLEQPWRALGALPVQCAFELLNPQLEKRDQRLLPTAPPVHWQPPPRLAAAPHARPEAPAGRSQDPMEDRSASIS